MEYLFVISLFAFILTFIAKFFTHITLDRKNGYPIEFGSAWGHISILPYDKDVSEEDERLKKICNKLQKLTILFLIIFLVVFFTRNLLQNK